MVYRLSSFAIAFSLLFSPLSANEPSSRSDNLKALLKEIFTDPMLQALAGQTINALDREVDPSQLVAKFREEMVLEPTWSQFAKEYDLFSDEEIGGLLTLFTSPLYKKFVTEGVAPMMANFATIQTLLQDLAQKLGAAAPVRVQESISSLVTEATKTNFASLVEQSDMPLILDVYAEWCSPCKRMAPLLDAASERYPQIRFVKIDYDKEPALANRYQINSFPTLLFFLPGENKPVIKSVGLLSDEALDQKIEQFKKMIGDLASGTEKAPEEKRN